MPDDSRRTLSIDVRLVYLLYLNPILPKNLFVLNVPVIFYFTFNINHPGRLISE